MHKHHLTIVVTYEMETLNILITCGKMMKYLLIIIPESQTKPE